MDIRKAFLDYFLQNDHELIESSPLVPDDDSLLFTNAGMVQFKPIFTGEIPRPKTPRACSSQTCIRAGGKHNDLDNVGYTARHHTFFEMLGNFSFGDYFKEDAIAYAWEFITKTIGFDEKKLWVTVHDSDDEAEKLWSKHIKKDRILRFGDKDNFWQMGESGPCGPCSEIFFDQGEEHFNSAEDKMGGDGDRFLEIWNLVFMQYEKSLDGKIAKLPKPSIDTGMGYERMVALYEGKQSNFDSSLFMPLIKEVENLCQKQYIYKQGASYRVIADHIRSTAFLLAQGVNFDKEGRGYVLRRILRRAIRHGYLLGIKEPFMFKLVDTLANIMTHYLYLQSTKEQIKEQIKTEEERFLNTIETGLDLFNIELKNTKKIFSGEVAFKLYDTYGFPLDLTSDMLREKNLSVDTDTFDELMQKQKTLAKASWKGSGDKISHGDFKSLIEEFGENEFVGYENLQTKSKVLALLDDDFQRVDILEKSGWVLLDKTPFYPEGGGQVGDKGKISDKGEVSDTKKFFNLNFSYVKLNKAIKLNEELICTVSSDRLEVQKHHSATHLLHAVLRNILGTSVAQAGSLVSKDRLRFDFSYPKALSQKQITQIEKDVNLLIKKSISAKVEYMSLEDAKQKGAMALFGEKYSNHVRVLSFDNESIELCGGCHVENTANIGSFFITKESGVSAGVRRIEAVCAEASLKLANSWRQELNNALYEVKAQEVVLGIKKLKDEIVLLKQELKNAQNSNQIKLHELNINNICVIIDELKVGDIKAKIDELKNQKQSLAVALFQIKNDKITIATGVKNANIKAGAWIKTIAQVLGGNGGGRDDFASAGGKDIQKLDLAKKQALDYIKENA